MSLITKNVWAHRRQNGWIFAEIAIITLLSMLMLNPIVVTLYNRIFYPYDNMDTKQLCVARVVETEDADSLPYAALLDPIRKLPEVESVCFGENYIGQYANLHNWSTYAALGDTTRTVNVAGFSYSSNVPYFETLGLKVISGSVPATSSEEELVNGIVITRMVARLLFGTEEAVGRQMVRINYSDLQDGNLRVMGPWTVAAVVENVKGFSRERYPLVAFTQEPIGYYENNVLIRLRPGVNPERFVEELRPRLKDELRVGKWMLAQLETYCQHLERESKKDDVEQKLLVIPLILFAINALLGILGTFWWQMRSRREDIGILRSFGASRRRIWLMFVGEGVLLSFLAFLLGDLVALNLYRSISFSDGGMGGIYGFQDVTLPGAWIDSFWPHFFVLSAVTYLLILVLVVVGISLPAWRACRISPVEALRES